MNSIPGPESTATTPPSQANLEAFQTLFPGAIQDGVLDAARLGEILAVEVAGLKDGKESFGLRWAGKGRAIEARQAQSFAALNPELEESVNWNASPNVFIEGDNLEVLKLLQNAYNDQVKLMYIDPPYNTGNDFVYNDDFSDPLAHYLEVTGQADSEGNRLVANTEVSGRKHSNWLTMLAPRLELGRNLLSQDGLVVISIDSTESANLRLLLNDIFGEENFIGEIIWTYGHGENAADISKNHEYLLVFARDASVFAGFRMTEEELFELGPIITDACFRAPQAKNPLSVLEIPAGVRSERAETFSIPKGRVSFGVSFCEFLDEAKFENGVLTNAIRVSAAWTMKSQCKAWFETLFSATAPEVLDSKSQRVVEIFFSRSGRLSYKKQRSASSKVSSHWTGSDLTYSRARAGLEALFVSGNPFSYPKPVELIRRMVELTTSGDDLVVDLFAGSATTGEAVLAQNTRDGMSRRYLLVTVDEATAQGSTARKMGFERIPDIARSRLKLVQKSLAQANAGFRALKLGPSNFNRLFSAESDQLSVRWQTKAPNFEIDSAFLEIAVSLGIRLDSEFVKHEGPGWTAMHADSVWIVSGDLENLDLLELSNLGEFRVLAAFEDDFETLDHVKANIYFACKKANITFKTF